MTKKKTSAQGTKSNAAGRATAVEAAPASKVANAVEPPSASELQLRSYEHAIQLFSQRKLPEARARFLEAVKGPAASISDKARTYTLHAAALLFMTEPLQERR